MSYADEAFAIVDSDGVLEGPGPAATLPLAFVNVGAISEAEKVRNQKLIRSTAMKSFRRRQQSERSLKGEGSSSSSSKDSAANPKSPRPKLKKQTKSDECTVSPTSTPDLSSDVPFQQSREASWLVIGSPNNRENDRRRLSDSDRSETLSNQSARSSPVLDSPLTILGGGRIDPFQLLPIKSSSQINELIDYCENANSVPLSSRLPLTCVLSKPSFICGQDFDLVALMAQKAQ